MKKLTILEIIVCVGVLLVPAAVMGGQAQAGPPGGLDVTILNPLPVPVEGSVTVTNDGNNPVPVSVINGQGLISSPIRIVLQSTPSISDTYLVPEGFQLKISHISIRVYKIDPDKEVNDVFVTFSVIPEVVAWFAPFAGPYPVSGDSKEFLYSSMVDLVIDQNKAIKVTGYGKTNTVTDALIYGLLAPID